jgi:2-polyprenyl-3-methyl-5-hydroxy-6-metoxy-1,4-benzoquinol methylase
LNGSELAYTPGLSSIAKTYIRIFGAPISGLRIRIRRILPVIGGSPEKILDAGCGRAVFSMLLARKFPHADVLGIDLDEEQLQLNKEIAQAAKLQNLRFALQDVELLPYREEFDVVLSVDNIEHIENDQMALESLANSLKTGGTLYLHVPAYERRWFFFTFRTNFDVPGHYRPGYTLEDISNKVQATGLHIAEAYYTYGWLENVSNNISYIITRAEAKNKMIYALFFPLLNLLSWLGSYSKPKKGAAIFIIATKLI